MKKTFALITGALVFGLTLSAHAAPMSFGSNSYDLIMVTDPYVGLNNHWDTASASAVASIYNGVNGHLATITSQEENDFLFSLVTGSYSRFTGAWLGGKAPEGWLVGPETGQTFASSGYTNWGVAGIEPNNAGYAYMNIGAAELGVVSGEWADDSGAQGFPSLLPFDPVIGYFVEYENAASVPEPATMLLLGSGMFGFGLFRRMRGKS